MLERNKGKLNVAVIFLIITVIIIGVMGAYIYLEKDKSDKKIGELENKIQNIEATVQKGIKEEEAKKLAEEEEKKKKENIVLSGTEPLDIYKYDLQGCLGLESESSSELEKYELTYNAYNKDGYVGKVKGKIEKSDEDSMLGGAYYLSYDNQDYDTNCRYYISNDYNAIPRKYEVLEEIPETIQEEIKENKEVYKITAEKVDLDGDGVNEIIVIAKYKNDNGERYITDCSEIYLYDENWNLIEKILENAGCEDVIDCEDVTYLDIDNDGIMEILVYLHCHSSMSYESIYKYSNGKVIGNFDTFNSETGG